MAMGQAMRELGRMYDFDEATDTRMCENPK